MSTEVELERCEAALRASGILRAKLRRLDFDWRVQPPTRANRGLYRDSLGTVVQSLGALADPVRYRIAAGEISTVGELFDALWDCESLSSVIWRGVWDQLRGTNEQPRRPSRLSSTRSERRAREEAAVREVEEERQRAGDHYASSRSATQVYFILDVEMQRIKIGKSNNSKNRLKMLQIANASELRLLGTTSDHSEDDLHARFEALRLRGEWYRAVDPLLEFLRVLGMWPAENLS